MNPKDKIDETKSFEMSFDDLDTAKAKAEAENRGEVVTEDKQPEKKVENKEPEEEEEEEKSEPQDKSKETKKEDKAPAKEEPKKEAKASSFPNKNEGESDEAYNLRMQLKVAKEGRDSATTEEEKSVFEKKMDELRDNLLEVNKAKKAEVETKRAEEKEEEEDTDPDLEDNLKKKGFIKKDEVETIFKQRLNELRKDEIVDGHKIAIKEFYKSRPDIQGNKEVRNFLEQEVINLIKPDLNTTPKQLFDALKLVSNAHFPKANKSEAATRSQEKVDVMNIEGTGKGGGKKATVGDKENDMLRSMGWSDDQISTFG